MHLMHFISHELSCLSIKNGTSVLGQRTTINLYPRVKKAKDAGNSGNYRSNLKLPRTNLVTSRGSISSNIFKRVVKSCSNT